MTVTQLKNMIATIPDFPMEGIQFKDISPILADPEAFQTAIDALAAEFDTSQFDGIVGIDARGFIFASALAYKMNKGLIMSRKAGKLPGKVQSYTYEYEYSKATLAIQENGLEKGKRYLVVDDVLATGHTASAVTTMIQEAGAVCAGVLVFIELSFLAGRKTLTEKTGLNSTTIKAVITL